MTAGRTYETIEVLRRVRFDYIEVFYNHQRLYSTLDYVRPANYESSMFAR